MIPLCVPPPLAQVPAPAATPLVEIAAGVEALGSFAPLHPGSAVPDGAAGSANYSLLIHGSAHPRPSGLGYARLQSLGDHTAVPDRGQALPLQREGEPDVLSGLSLSPLSRQASGVRFASDLQEQEAGGCSSRANAARCAPR